MLPAKPDHAVSLSLTRTIEKLLSLLALKIVSKSCGIPENWWGGQKLKDFASNGFEQRDTPLFDKGADCALPTTSTQTMGAMGWQCTGTTKYHEKFDCIQTIEHSDNDFV